MNDGQTWVVIGGFVTMLAALLTVVPWLLRGQNVQVQARFDALEATFGGRFDRVDGRLDRLDERLDDVSDRLGGLEQDVARLRGDVDHLTATMTPITDELLRAGLSGRPRATG